MILKPLNLLFDIFFPILCNSCRNPLTNGEKYVCVSCLHNLAYCSYSSNINNKTAKIFYGRVNISFASSFLYFSKNGYTQNIIHNLKYKGRLELGSFLAELYVPHLIDNNIGKIDFVLGVPLHKSKLKKRGFNQVDTFGQTLADKLGAVYSRENLVRISFNNSQTKKNRIERWKNVSEIFKIENPSEFQNKNVLLVDDVVTTGATLEACIKLLNNIKGVKVSIATIAITE